MSEFPSEKNILWKESSNKSPERPGAIACLKKNQESTLIKKCMEIFLRYMNNIIIKYKSLYPFYSILSLASMEIFYFGKFLQ